VSKASSIAKGYGSGGMRQVNGEGNVHVMQSTTHILETSRTR
jgi:hypothetical protein